MLSSDDFVENHLKPSRPVIMRGAATEWDWRRKWTRRSFSSSFGERIFQTGEIPYPEIFGTVAQNMSVAEYLRHSIELETVPDRGSAAPYIFHEIQGPTDKLAEGFNPFPPFLREVSHLVDVNRPKAVQFYLGAAGSGAPVHFHCALHTCCTKLT